MQDGRLETTAPRPTHQPAPAHTASPTPGPRRAPGGGPPVSPDPQAPPCPICQPPLPAGVRRRYCSPACKTAAWKRQHRDRPTSPPRHTPPAPPAAIRDCPHCGQPVAIVALLTTPQVAGPQLATGTPDVIPLRPVRTT